jgi:hypothetical protein
MKGSAYLSAFLLSMALLLPFRHLPALLAACTLIEPVGLFGGHTYSPVWTVALVPQAAGYGVYLTQLPVGAAATYRYTGPTTLDVLGRAGAYGTGGQPRDGRRALGRPFQLHLGYDPLRRALRGGVGD